MSEIPDISRIAALVGDPTRSNMLTALMAGQALTATELAQQAGITAQTASSHLTKLVQGGLVTARKSGRHRYFSLSGADVGAVLENLMQFAASRGHVRVHTGPKDPALRKARVCYTHLAGEMGVQVFESLFRRNFIAVTADDVSLTASGHQFVEALGVSVSENSKRPLCRSCLDWSVRRNHLAGRLGEALLDRMFELNWATREKDSRVVFFSIKGEAAFTDAFG